MGSEAVQLGDPMTTLTTVLLVAFVPFLLMVGTAFVKISVVLYIVRSAIGAQQVPPGPVVLGVAFLLTAFVMTPVAQQAFDQAAPALDGDGELTGDEMAAAFDRALPVVSSFLARNAHESNIAMFADLSEELSKEGGEPLAEDHVLVLLPAFAISELTEAFAIGFILFLPFLVIDLVIANILLSLGMHMLSPTTVSLPFKLLLFVLVDGWVLLARGLLLGYA